MTEQSPPPVPASPDAPRPDSRRALLWAALSGLLLVGSFPHLDWGWLAWVALVPFLSTFPHRRMRDAVGAGFVLGLVFFGGLWYWMGVFAGHVIGPALSAVIWLGAALSQTVTVMVFAAGAQALSRKTNPWAWRLGVPALWAVLEWARQFGVLGTDWGDLAYTQHSALVILQTTKLAGVFGLSFLIVLVNVTLTPGLRDPTPHPSLSERRRELGKRVSTLSFRKERVARLAVPGEVRPGVSGQVFPLAVGGIILSALAYGGITLATENLRPNFVAAALQADVNQNVKWTPQYAQNTLSTFGAQAREASQRGAKLVVWPETAFPGYLGADPGLRAQAAAMAVQNHEAMLVGAVDYDTGARKNANALFLVNADGTLGGSYRKQRLVPFGEYVPFRKWLPFLGKLQLTIYDMVPGGARQPVLDAGAPVGRVGTAICYDSTDGEIMRRQVARGADLLVVSTDDTWFGRTAAARQHAACAAVRAAEEDRYLVRCAATGISQVIAPSGRVLTEAGLFTRSVVSAPVQARHDLTPYTRWGDWLVALCAAGLFLCLPPWHRLRAGRHQV